MNWMNQPLDLGLVVSNERSSSPGEYSEFLQVCSFSQRVCHFPLVLSVAIIPFCKGLKVSSPRPQPCCEASPRESNPWDPKTNLPTVILRGFISTWMSCWKLRSMVGKWVITHL